MRYIKILILTIFLSVIFPCISTAAPKITQAYHVNFKVNDVIVVSVEEIDKPAKLLFINTLGNNDIVYSEEFLKDSKPIEDEEIGGYIFTNPFLRFKVFDVSGFQQPVVVATAVIPSGSCNNYQTKILTELNGKITHINPEDLNMSTQDGFYMGYINKEYGNGLITWRFKWEESHYEPHRYEINIYSWVNKSNSYKLNKSFVTKKKYVSGCSALSAYKLNCKNYINEVTSEIEVNTIGIEAKFLKK